MSRLTDKHPHAAVNNRNTPRPQTHNAVPPQTARLANARHPSTPAHAGLKPNTQPAGSNRPHVGPAAPPVYRPQSAKLMQPKAGAAGPTAPAVYKPNPVPKVLQRKASATHGARAAAAQPKAGSVGPSAPPVYRPNPTPKVLQRKVSVNSPVQAKANGLGRVNPHAATPRPTPAKAAAANAAARPGNHLSKNSPPRTVQPFVRPGGPAVRRANVVQAMFPLRKFFNDKMPVEKNEEIYQGMETIQKILQNKEAVRQSLGKLEVLTKDFKEKGLTETQALNQALAVAEQQWMNPGRIKIPAKGSGEVSIQLPKTLKDVAEGKKKSDIELALGGSGQLTPQALVEMTLKPVLPLKDVGAAVPHGEYAHRIQWFVILDQMKDAQQVRKLYDVMGNPDLIIKQPANLVEKVEGKDTEVEISLWDAVLDARGTWTRGVHGEALPQEKSELLKEWYSDVGFASPTYLTGELTNKDKIKTASGGLAEEFPTLSDAVTVRRMKRGSKEKVTGEVIRQKYYPKPQSQQENVEIKEGL